MIKEINYSGCFEIEFLIDKSNNLYFLEINTIPGSLAFYLWAEAGVPYAKLIDRMVEYAEKAYEDRNNASYAYTSDILKNISIGGAKGTKGAKGAKVGR